MTDNQPHTPTTEEVRDGYSRNPPGHAVSTARERQAAEFDRWYQAEIAAAEQRGAVKALREFADAHRMPFVMFSGKDYTVTVSDLLRETARNIELGKYRADLLEGDDD